MRLNHLITLIGTTSDSNAMGDAILNLAQRETHAARNSVRQSEMYQAVGSGLKPEIMFTVRETEYAGETKLKYEGKTYQIIRSYQRPDRMTELICTGLVNGGI
ncbi:phage head closure protein [Paenibacillus sp. DMB5]|uniref:phage head closure protein n=1 Tax=Paenibacillus sp. DMB5 TaxID=1780103 RepID=UPI00076DEE60|nr:phage head closure protein [Paenibacillus sp. DMB5]KUP24916.1 hypothetical protein AWJ19_03260 [Paenibacillus sp. DMB5]